MNVTDGRQDISVALDDEDDKSLGIITKDHDSARSKDLAAKFNAAVRVIQTIPNSKTDDLFQHYYSSDIHQTLVACN